ncbi:MAG: zinc ribbon domain-containing protein [Clostridia bacterium]|nr:zinc ribbon domain-containing protein [Clostridia bacterium]
MKHIKPGRGPSMMGGIGAIAVGIFGVIWTIGAASMGGGLFALFGVVFVGMAIAMAVYNFKNATGKERYSAFDIVDDTEEPDPLQSRYGKTPPASAKRKNKFCPWCGAKVDAEYEFCNECGKKLP